MPCYAKYVVVLDKVCLFFFTSIKKMMKSKQHIFPSIFIIAMLPQIFVFDDDIKCIKPELVTASSSGFHIYKTRLQNQAN